jgi:hypothetical protein
LLLDQFAVLPHVALTPAEFPFAVHVPLCAYTRAGLARTAKIAKAATEMAVHRVRSATLLAPMPIMNLVLMSAMNVTFRATIWTWVDQKKPASPCLVSVGT